MDFPERDWKRLRSLHPIALERYCERVLDQCFAVMRDPGTTAHDRYLRVYRVLQERDAALAMAFDDLRRSTATRRLASMVQLGLLTSDELDQFSPETRVSVTALAEILASSSKVRERDAS